MPRHGRPAKFLPPELERVREKLTSAAKAGAGGPVAFEANLQGLLAEVAARVAEEAAARTAPPSKARAKPKTKGPRKR